MQKVNRGVFFLLFVAWFGLKFLFGLEFTQSLSCKDCYSDSSVAWEGVIPKVQICSIAIKYNMIFCTCYAIIS